MKNIYGFVKKDNAIFNVIVHQSKPILKKKKKKKLKNYKIYEYISFSK